MAAKPFVRVVKKAQESEKTSDLSEAQLDKQCDPVTTPPTECAPAASETDHPAAPKAVADTGDDQIPTKLVLTDTHPSESGSEPAAETDVTAENTDINEELSAVATPGDAKDTPEDSSTQSETETDHPAVPEAVADTGDGAVPTKLVLTDTHPSESGSEPATETDVTAENTDINEEPSAAAATPGDAKDTPEDSSTQSESETGHPAAPTAQDEARENDPIEPPINDDAHANAVAENTADAELVPAGFSDDVVAEDQPSTDTAPAMVEGQDSDAGQPESGSEKSRAPANAQMISQIVLSILHGMTDDNATGESKAKAQAEFNVLRKAIKKTVEGKRTFMEKKSYVEGMYTTMLPIDTKAKVLTAVSSTMRGDAAMEMKKGIPHGQFRKAIEDKFPGQRFRKMQEDMSIAGINSVERHFDLGVSLLLQLAAIIKKSGLNKYLDPIQTILNQAKGDTGFLEQDYETLARIAIADFKLKKAQLVIDPATLRDFIAAGYTLDSKDIKEMLAMQNGEDSLDPSTFLQDITNNAGIRVFALTSAAPAEDQADALPTIPDINSTLVKATETLSQALSLPEFPKKDVDRIAVRNLMEVLKQVDDATNLS